MRSADVCLDVQWFPLQKTFEDIAIQRALTNHIDTFVDILFSH